MKRCVSVQEIGWYGVRQPRVFYWNHFPDTGPTVASIWGALKRQEEKLIAGGWR
jgi:hypothetical protein